VTLLPLLQPIAALVRYMNKANRRDTIDAVLSLIGSAKLYRMHKWLTARYGGAGLVFQPAC
jgi:hypothetical protein